jgi:molybdopterin molybdotransferase
MPEFLKLLPPDEARALLLSQIGTPAVKTETVDTGSALHRVTAEEIHAPHPLPEFTRSSVDGYAVRAQDTYGAGDSSPAYLPLAGEVPMGAAPEFDLAAGKAALIHTGGMLPAGSNAVVMLENTQAVLGPANSRRPKREAGRISEDGPKVESGLDSGMEIEVLKAAAVGENVIRAGEDVAKGQVVVARGVRLRAAEIGGLMALGIVAVRVAIPPKVGIISSGDEIVDPYHQPAPGQVRDVNAYALACMILEQGGEPVHYGIVQDDMESLRRLAARASDDCDVILISGGSSASARDTTAEVIQALGGPGVLVHGINIRPGKPTILGECGGKVIVGLPGNPVSALVIGYLFVGPVLERLLGLVHRGPAATIRARLTVNLPSQAGREDWWPVKLRPSTELANDWLAEPIFGKSNLIFSLAAAAGLIRIPPEANGLAAGEVVSVHVI